MIMFLFLLVGLCFVLHNMCVEKGISPWRYLFGFITGFFLSVFGAFAAFIFFYGKNVLQDSDAAKSFAPFLSFAMMFQFLLFIFFRQKIGRFPDLQDEDDETHIDPPSGEKKDLSYFR